MIYYKTEAEIAIMRESCLLVGKVLAEVAKFLKAGVTTMQANKVAEDFIYANNAVPNFYKYKDYPFTACISVNDAVVHGFPTNDVLKKGDIVSVDLGVFKNGFHGDSAYTFAIGNPGEEVLKLMRVTKNRCIKALKKRSTEIELATSLLLFRTTLSGNINME